MLETAIAIGALIVLAFVLWLRLWVDDHSHPYDWRRSAIIVADDCGVVPVGQNTLDRSV